VFLQPYLPHELHFAYCYRVFLRYRTHEYRPYPQLALLKRSELDGLARPYNIRVLECASDATDLPATLSLRPTETISGATDKLKGRVSKWLREALQLQQPTNLLSKGYFACTIGKSRRRAAEKYLSSQGEHHGYAQRPLPPVFVERYELSAEDVARISPKHAAVVAQFHLVMSTSGRRGILGAPEGRRIATEWRRLQLASRIALVKVSFVPDHVHVAFRAHPASSPADIACALMNSAQEVISSSLISARLERLWRPSAYLGSYGDLASSQIRKYLEHWEIREQ
jgi:REP element-mobilizing transposase RayT